MTTCSECLAEMSTVRLAAAGPGSAVSLHCAQCPECAAVAQDVAYAERRLAYALNNAQPGMLPSEVSVNAMEGSEQLRRKRVGRWVRGVLLAAGAGFLAFAANDYYMSKAEQRGQIPMETISLRCLTPEQAIELVTPYLRSSGSAVYMTKGLHVITMRGRVDEFLSAKNQLRYRDAPGQCSLPGPATAPQPDATIPPASGTPGKD